jgi:hypothetical protein
MAPVMALIVIALVRYTGADRVRHLAYLLLLGWLAWLYALHSDLRLALVYAAAAWLPSILVSLPVPRLSVS